MIDLAHHYKKNRKPKFYKMYDGVPNFHRAIDKKITKNTVFMQLNTHSIFIIGI